MVVLLYLEWSGIFYRRENGLSLLFFQIAHTVYLTRKRKEQREKIDARMLC